MFESFPKATVDIVSPDGTVRHTTKALLSPGKALLPDSSVTVLVGDEIRRMLPNGTEETFEVIDPVFSDGLGSIPPHFNIKTRRKGAYAPHTGGNYNIHITGPNARVNVHSQDNSTNTVKDNRVFNDLRAAINSRVDDERSRGELLEQPAAMEQAQNNPGAFTKAYQAFIASAANHMTVVAPFIPALTQLLA